MENEASGYSTNIIPLWNLEDEESARYDFIQAKHDAVLGKLIINISSFKQI